MRKINKGSEPPSLTEWKRRFPQSIYRSMLDDNTTESIALGVRDDIRRASTKEQYYLCAYCCQEITGQGNNTSNEHIIPQSRDASQSLIYNNIIASCQTPKQCDKQHKDQHLPLYPLMNECETEINYDLYGGISGTTQRAKTAITVLGLDNKSITEKRKRIIRATLRKEGFKNQDILDLKIEDCDFLKIIVEDQQNVTDGKFLPFAPVIINALQNFMKG